MSPILLISIFIVSIVTAVIITVVMVNILNRSNQKEFLILAKQQYEAEQNKAITELETRKQSVDDSVKGLKEQLNKYEQLIHEIEKDRIQKYGNLENELKNASNATTKLQDTTNRLNDILGNVKSRGQWGERMAEDIIQSSGLIEGTNYTKQKKLSSSDTKPDYTFILPNEHIVNMDVKFPLDNYLKMVNAESSIEKDQFEKEFIKNVKDRIKEIQNRDYINPAEHTLDFVMLFIPNEQVFGIIQEKAPGIVDESLKQKVVLCSPFTLYAMLSIIRQAHEHFRFEKDIKKIIKDIKLFSKYFEGFKKRFDKIGSVIESLEKTYTDVKVKSFKNLETKIQHIENYKNGSKIAIEHSEDAIDIEIEEEKDDVIV